MRNLLLLLLALMVPMTFTACQDSPREEAFEEGAPPGDREDVIGDGEIIDEPGEPEGNMFETYDADRDGFLSEQEYRDGVGDENWAQYDTDGDGRISMDEYRAYWSSRM